MTVHRVPMSPVDAAWYHIDGPANLAIVTGMLLTRGPLDIARVRDAYRVRLSRYARFGQRVVEAGLPIATPHWEDVPGFDIGSHVWQVRLPAPRDQQSLMTLVSLLASSPLDRDRPLWDAYVVDDVPGGSALIMRFHHCIGDGTAMMAVAQELFDPTADAPLGAPMVRREAAPSDEPLFRWLGPARELIDASTRAVSSTLQTTVHVVQHPQEAIETLGRTLAGAVVLVDELLKTGDPASPLKGRFGAQKRVAWSAAVPLDAVKAIGASCGAKVNDVLVAAVSGALRSYLAGRGLDVDRLSLHAMVPVDLRDRTRPVELCNEFGLVILPLAIEATDPAERLRRTKTMMDGLKRSPEAGAILTLFNIFGRGPKVIEDIAVDLFGSRASLVLTNVAGSREPLFLAGAEIERFMFWVPHPGRQLGMGVSILSYNGQVSLAVVADAHLVPDPETITEAFADAFAALQAGTRVPDRSA